MARTGKIYQQLMDSIRNKIISGELTINEKLESERVMSEKYGINRMTVRNALKHLEEEGVLESRRGSGTYVKAIPRMEEKIGLGDESEILSLSMQIRQKGMKSSRVLISMSKIVPTGVVSGPFIATLLRRTASRVSGGNGVPCVSMHASPAFAISLKASITPQRTWHSYRTRKVPHDASPRTTSSRTSS